MNRIFSFALMALLFASCQSSTENETADYSSDATTTSDAPAPGTTEAVTLNPVAGDEALSTVPNPAAGTTPANQGKVALNPEHGMPGHRCEIPVGAPLNTPAGAAPAAAPMTITPQPAAPAPAAQPASASGRVNPPHGQPGHSCDIPVGAPLNG